MSGKTLDLAKYAKHAKVSTLFTKGMRDHMAAMVAEPGTPESQD